VGGAGERRVGAEPVGRVAGQAGGADQGDAGGGVGAEVVAQEIHIQGVTWGFGAGVGVRVDQAGEEPAFGHQLRAAHRIGGPAVAVRIQVTVFAVGQRGAADSKCRHRFDRSVSTLISLGAKIRSGGPQKPAPRVV
jgi:hypothetical protein